MKELKLGDDGVLPIIHLEKDNLIILVLKWLYSYREYSQKVRNTDFYLLWKTLPSSYGFEQIYPNTVNLINPISLNRFYGNTSMQRCVNSCVNSMTRSNSHHIHQLIQFDSKEEFQEWFKANKESFVSRRSE
jgi:predicted enzyme involved in methoxymalonyl-ACP biosynthesis